MKIPTWLIPSSAKCAAWSIALLPMLAHAQDPAKPPPPPQFSDAQRGNSMARLTGTGMKIISEAEGLLVLDTRGKKLTPGSQLLFVRIREGNLDILARGEVAASQKQTSLVKLHKDSITKYPGPGDMAIGIGTPWTPKKEPVKDPPPSFIYAEDPPPPGDPGYIQFESGMMNGSLGSEGSTDGNRYKNGSFDFSRFRALVFWEFAWRIGFEYESISGQYPTSTYFHEEGPSTESYTQFALHARGRRILNDWLRPSAKLASFNHTFNTINNDENLISSTYSGLGLGGRLAMEFAPTLYTPERGWGVKVQDIAFDATFYPKLDAKDLTISRGTSSTGSTAMEWKLSASAVVYLKWIPFVKRFLVTFNTGVRSYDLKFQGQTTSETGGPYVIPEEGSYSEKRDFTQITLGVRFDDFVGKFINPR